MLQSETSSPIISIGKFNCQQCPYSPAFVQKNAGEDYRCTIFPSCWGQHFNFTKSSYAFTIGEYFINGYLSGNVTRLYKRKYNEMSLYCDFISLKKN